jgi:hypothetical protein
MDGINGRLISCCGPNRPGKDDKMRIERKLLLLPLHLTLLLLCRPSSAYKKKQRVTEADAASAAAAVPYPPLPQEETCVIGNDGVCLNNVPPLPGVVNDFVEVPYGEKQNVVGESANDMKQRLKQIHQYMYGTVYPTMGELGPHCKLNHKGANQSSHDSLPLSHDLHIPR